MLYYFISFLAPTKPWLTQNVSLVEVGRRKEPAGGFIKMQAHRKNSCSLLRFRLQQHEGRPRWERMWEEAQTRILSKAVSDRWQRQPCPREQEQTAPRDFPGTWGSHSHAHAWWKASLCLWTLLLVCFFQGDLHSTDSSSLGLKPGFWYKYKYS